VSARAARRIAALLGVLGLAAAPASASEAITSFTLSPSSTQAGAHPDLSASFALAVPGAPESAREVVLDAPKGLFGNPGAVTRCHAADFALAACPADSQVGLVTVRANYEGDPNKLLGTAPIFSMVPGEDQTALFAFIVPVLGAPVNIPVSVRTASDYGLRFTVSEITQAAPPASAQLTFWGFPAAEEHDAQRFPKGSISEPANCAGKADTSCLKAPTHSSLPEHPLTDNPTVCAGALSARLEVRTYQDPGHPTSKEAAYPAITGCEAQTFKPVLYASPTTGSTDSPSGLNVELSNPQFLSHANAPSEIRSAIVTLPEGFTINPDAADGQSACTDSEANLASEAPTACPDSAKIGTFALHTIALEGALAGSVYIGTPKPGEQYRLIMAADGFGIHAKILGKVIPDPATGRLSAYFTDLPQAPFDDFELHLFASDRGLMATPTHCSLYPVSAQFYPWNGALADQTSTQFFNLDSGPGGSLCPPPARPFNPRLAAGTTNPAAGAYSDFHLRLEREDGDQNLGDVNFTLPPGFSGDLRGIPYCPEAAIAAAAGRSGADEQSSPSCPAASRLGSSNVAAGPGSHPFHASGQIYLSGPFKGAPLSLVAITPAVAGPFDYGVVVVRVALHIDPITARVTALSDSIPQIIGGVPIRLRSIRVDVDRPHFTLNPTNCSPMSVDSQGIGDQGAVAAFSSYFHVVNCSTLPFEPRLRIRQLGRRSATKRNRNPSLRFDLTTRPGEANISSLAVTLPKAFEIDQRHLGNICSRAQLAAERCAGRQPIGSITVETPLLDQPLSGPAYAVSGFGKLPHLVFILAGQVLLTPEAVSSSVKGGHLRTVVPTVPDAPVGHLRFDLLGGKQGYLVNTRALCRSETAASVRYVAQSGRVLNRKVKVKTPCGKRKQQKKQQANHRRRLRHRRSR
jgi:hypothetical protein